MAYQLNHTGLRRDLSEFGTMRDGLLLRLVQAAKGPPRREGATHGNADQAISEPTVLNCFPHSRTSRSNDDANNTRTVISEAF